MIVKDYTLTVDFDKGIKYPAMRFVKGDSQSCAFNFSIVQDITDLSLVVTFKLPDETSYIQGAEIKGPHEAYLMLPSDVLSQVGKVLCQVAIHNDGRLTNAVPFSYLVVEDLAEGAIEASDQYPILTQLITDCEAIEDAEALRVAAEGAADPPSGRIGAELNRVDAEVIRLANEGDETSGRVKAELDRVAAEEARVAAEGAASPKSGRVGAELDRVDAELARVAAEGDATKGRVKAENDRVAAEEAREVAEGLRQAHIADTLKHKQAASIMQSGTLANAEGYFTKASGGYAHAEGNFTIAHGEASHAEGYATEANGEASHAEGQFSIASGRDAHAQNLGTLAQGFAQTAVGMFNVGQGSAVLNPTDNAFIVGNGAGDLNRSNAMSLTWSGDLTLAGGVTAAGNVNIATGKKYKINNTDLSASDVGAVATTDIVNTLIETEEGKVLDARQGKAISDKIGNQTYTEQNYIADGESATESIDKLDMSLKDTVPKTRTINGHPLTADVTLDGRNLSVGSLRWSGIATHNNFVTDPFILASQLFTVGTGFEMVDDPNAPDEWIGTFVLTGTIETGLTYSQLINSGKQYFVYGFGPTAYLGVTTVYGFVSSAASHFQQLNSTTGRWSGIQKITGYALGYDLSEDDKINESISKLNKFKEKIALFIPAGVRSTTLEGLSAADSSPILSSDSILVAIGKFIARIGIMSALPTTIKNNLVGAISELHGLVVSINSEKMDKSARVNTLTETEEGKVLDARQGKTLSDKIGNQTYTEQNYITDAESITESIDKLDIQAKKSAGAVAEAFAFFVNEDMELVMRGYSDAISFRVDNGYLIQEVL